MNREPVGYVVEVEGTNITLNLLDHHRGMVASHFHGISPVTEIGSLLGIDSGHKLLIFRVDGVSFAEPKEVHRQSSEHESINTEPLRNIKGTIVGIISRENEKIVFIPSRLTTPALGAMAFPLAIDELASIYSREATMNRAIKIGNDLRNNLEVEIDLQDLISRHVAVLGSSGQGKSCFTAAVLQQIMQLENSRVVIFDINGEYEQALKFGELSEFVDVTRIGKDFTIPYYALGRQGIQRLLIPSEKTQRPALNFALDALMHVKWFSDDGGVGLLDDQSASMFDDCRSQNAYDAHISISSLQKKIRNRFSEHDELFESPDTHDKEEDCQDSKPKKVFINGSWPPMIALAPLVADSHSLEQKNGKWTRSAFLYGNVSPLINRIHRFIEDDIFSTVVDTGEGPQIGKSNMKQESAKLSDRIFGGDKPKWRVHIIDLRIVAHDLMPFILGALLELYSAKLFERGQDKKKPTLLVLEEAHHYLRSPNLGDDDIGSSLAYERLAKEGRKFGLSLWLSTQRPSEISETVLSQCNNWISFRLTSEKDLSTIRSANEWADRSEVDRITGLSRQDALLFGGSVNMPILFRAQTANPLPKSEDAVFGSWWRSVQSEL